MWPVPRLLFIFIFVHDDGQFCYIQMSESMYWMSE